MHVHQIRLWVAALVVAPVLPAVVALPPQVSGAGPAEDVVVADWSLDDPPGSTVMVDRSGHGHDGAVDARAEAAGLTLTGSTYSWGARCRDCPPTAESRVVQVPDDPALDVPDPAVPWSVQLRFRTTTGHGNVLQKGQSTTPGGQIKVEDPQSLRCVFLGAGGTGVSVSSPTPLDDGAWHVATCVHEATAVSLWVDGVLVATRAGATGPIDNAMPLTVGGKVRCDQTAVGCDYYVGSIDWVRITRGGAVPPPTSSPTPTPAPSATPTTTAAPTTSEPPTATVAPAPSPAPTVPVRVVAVVSGDTVKVRHDGRVRRVRILGIDSPGLPQGCGARRATADLAARLPRGTRIRLVPDPTQPRVDRHGQLVRYVVVDHLDVGRWQVHRGNAEVETSRPRFTRYAAYVRVERDARRHARGLWGSCPADSSTSPGLSRSGSSSG